MKRVAIAAVGFCLLTCSLRLAAQSVSPDVVPYDDGVEHYRLHKGGTAGDAGGEIIVHLDAAATQRLIVTRHVAALSDAGAAALARGDYPKAEADYRAAIAQEEDWPQAYAGLAETLTAQGRVAEAIATYRTAIYGLPLKYNHHSDDPAEQELYRAEAYQDPFRYGGFGSSDDLYAWMQYAVLLAQTGQWPEAVNIYEGALAHYGMPSGGTGPKIDVHFDPDVPQPTSLEAAAHLVSGLESNFTGWEDDKSVGQNHRALREYAKAVALEPEWGIANYYYGYGLQKLGRTAEARAAFQKTAKIAKGDVKLAAQRALARSKKPA